MASSNAKVDTGIMRQGAGTISDHAGQITAEEGAVKTTIDTLMATWKGNAAQVFDGAMQEFYSECDKIISKLQQLSTDVATAANNYDTHDDVVNQTVRSAMPSMRSGLPGL